MEHTPKTAASKKRRSFWWAMLEADTEAEALEAVKAQFQKEADPRTDCPVYGMATDITDPVLRYIHGTKETPADHGEPTVTP